MLIADIASPRWLNAGSRPITTPIRPATASCMPEAVMTATGRLHNLTSAASAVPGPCCFRPEDLELAPVMNAEDLRRACSGSADAD